MTVPSLGKGEAESSNLSSSTIFPQQIQRIALAVTSSAIVRNGIKRQNIP